VSKRSAAVTLRSIGASMIRRGHRGLVLGAGLAAAVALGGTARAEMLVNLTGGVLGVQDVLSEANNLQVRIGATGGVEIEEFNVGFASPFGDAPESTTAGPPGTVRIIRYAAGAVTQINLLMGDLSDNVSVTDTPTVVTAFFIDLGDTNHADTSTINDVSAGATTIICGPGNDNIAIINMTGGQMQVAGGDGVDTLTIFDSNATGAGGIQIQGDGGNDVLSIQNAHGTTVGIMGGTGADDINITDSNATTGTSVAGDENADDIDITNCHGGLLIVTGGSGNDNINIAATNATAASVAGDGGNDTIIVSAAGGTSLTVSGGDDGDTNINVTSQATSTTVNGDTDGATSAVGGADTIVIGAATTGDQVLVQGGPANDTITLQDTATTVFTKITGNAGNDTLNITDAHGANLEVTGEGGSDIFNLTDTHTATTLNGGGGVDTFNLANANGSSLAASGDGGNDIIVLTASGATANVIAGGAGVDDIDVLSCGGDTLLVAGGDDGDTVDVDSSATTSTTIAGDTDGSTATGAGGGDELAGGADTITVDDCTSVDLLVLGGPANDIIVITDTNASSGSVVSGNDGNDNITVTDAGGGGLIVSGNAGTDSISLTDTHTATSLSGGTEADTIAVTTANGSFLSVSGNEAGDDIDLFDSFATQTIISGGAGVDDIDVATCHGDSLNVAGGDDGDFIDVLTDVSMSTTITGDTSGVTTEELGGGDPKPLAPGDDLIVITDAFGDNLLVVAGPGMDTVQLIDTHTTVSTTITGNAGVDLLQVANAHTPTLNVTGDEDADQIDMLDSFASTITQLAGGPGPDVINVDDANTAALVVAGGTEDDQVNVLNTGTSAGPAGFQVLGGGGTDALDIFGTIVLTGPFTFDVEDTDVRIGAILRGDGNVTGSLDVFGAALLGPGQPVGQIIAGPTQLMTASTYEARINGTTPIADHDLLQVVGTVDVTNCALSLDGTWVPMANEQILLVNNDGADPVVGTFSGLPEGAPILFNGVTTFLTYTGGDGNDIVLFGPVEISVVEIDAVKSEGTETEFPLLVFQIVRSHNVGDHSITWETTDGTAMSVAFPEDFIPQAPTKVDFPTGGALGAFLTVAIIGDEIVELDENMFVDLSLPSPGVIVVDGQAEGQIINDDRGFISIEDVTDFEGDSGITPFDFVVTLSHAVDVDTNVDFATMYGTAKAGDWDYTFRQGTVTWPMLSPPMSQMIITIDVIGDTKFEPDEAFRVILDNIQVQGRNITFLDNEAQGLILNDDDLIEGACCITASGVCEFMSPLQCAQAGGVYQGTSTICAQVSCPQPALGACCFLDTSCDVRSAHSCSIQGGFYQGDSTDCGVVTCPTPDLSERADASTKGSLFFVSKVEVRWAGTAPFGVIQDTFVSLTNDYPEDVLVQMYFINGDAPLDEQFDDNTGVLVERSHLGWNWVDNAITLTGNEASYWSVLTGNPKGLTPIEALDPGVPPGRPALDGTGDRVLRGYIIGFAVNSSGEEIVWNHLGATATIVDYLRTAAWEYTAFTTTVVDGVAGHGQPSGTPGRLHIDGTEYAAMYDELLFNFQAASSAGFTTAPPAQFGVVSDTDLTLHPVSADLRQTNDGPVTTKASFLIWNENETKFSGTHRCITCWDQTLISDYDDPNHMLRIFLQTDHGKARIDGHASDECDDLGAGFESRRAAILGVAARQLRINGGFPAGSTAYTGTNLVGLGFEAALVQHADGGLPGEAEEPEPIELPFDPSMDDLRRFLDAAIQRGTSN
jgi:hypothetical protein